MHKQAAEYIINKGLSPVIRYVLALASAVAGIALLTGAPETKSVIFAYACGVFCLLITIACVTRGRVRQFTGSLVGCGLLALSFWYLEEQVADGVPFFSPRNEPSVMNAILFFGAFGLPGISYAIKVRFGFRASETNPPADSPNDAG